MEIDIDKLEALRAGCTSLGDPNWTAGCVRLVLERGQAAVETDDDSIPSGPDCFSAEWITAIHNSAPELFAELRRLRAIEAAAKEYVEIASNHKAFWDEVAAWDKFKAALAQKP